MGLNIEYLYGQTPLDEDEKEGLLIETISTHRELDEFEQKNIEQAIQWMLSRRFRAEKVLTEKFVRDVHKRMYGEVWRWAGAFRKTDKNIGVPKWEISPALKALLDDTLFWIANETFPPDEIAVRFKHRLVAIHCFPNGNGRHSRLMGDLLVRMLGRPVFTWGATVLSGAADARAQYLAAVKAADRGEIEGLLRFARE